MILERESTYHERLKVRRPDGHAFETADDTRHDRRDRLLLLVSSTLPLLDLIGSDLDRRSKFCNGADGE